MNFWIAKGQKRKTYDFAILTNFDCYTTKKMICYFGLESWEVGQICGGN